MKTTTEYTPSTAEQTKIEAEIKDDLVEHFFKAAPVGIISGFFASLSIFLFLYNTSPTSHATLIIWLLGFNLNTALTTILYFSYRQFKSKYEIQKWGNALSSLVIIYTIYYGSCILFIPHDPQNQLLLIVILFMIGATFSTTTVGLFKLCVIAVAFCIIPLAAWFFLQAEFSHQLGGCVAILAYIFFLGMNYRSTTWLINSLRLSKMVATVTHQANYDLLTDLPNQRLLTEYIQESIQEFKEKNQHFAVVCFGINRLEMVNQSLGYQVGDLIMQSITKRFTSYISDLKGDYEYILTLPRHNTFTLLIKPKNNLSPELTAKKIQEELIQLFHVLDTPLHLGQRESRLTASTGVAAFPECGNDWDTLLSNGYAAMFHAKMLGGNQIIFYKKEINERTPYLLELENDLHHALQRRQFELYYQPIIDLNVGQISGMEALIRWNHPTRGLISPIDFIPLAEETNLIIPIGAWALEEAISQVMYWNENGFSDLSLKVAVNVAPKQLRQGNLLATIDNLLKKTGVDPRFLEIELTETALLDAEVAPLIKEISKRGIGLSIDDFGTGYSGLSYLKSFTIDKLKIDKSFIDDVVTNSESATIVSAIIGMAKELGMKTLAEGVEKLEQLEFLQNKDCRYIQGYYFSKPLTVNEFTQYLKDVTKHK